MQPASPERSQATEITLRPARESDLEFIADTCRKVFLEYGSYDRYVVDWFRETIVSTCIAEADSAPVGFFMLAIHPPDRGVPSSRAIAELLSIAVVSDHRSRGVGGALIDRAIGLARESKLAPREIRLSVAEGNARAQRLFARRGFRIGRAVGIYPAGQRALFMSKALEKEAQS